MTAGHSPSHGLHRASSLREGAKVSSFYYFIIPVYSPNFHPFGKKLFVNYFALFPRKNRSIILP